MSSPITFFRLGHRSLQAGLLVGALSLAATAGVSRAALLTGSVVTTGTGTIDLTTVGTTDWAIWNITSSSPVASPVAPTNQKTGVTSVISGVTATSTLGDVRGSSVAGAVKFSYTDGTNPTTLVAANQGEAFDSTLNAGGLTLTITSGAANVPEVVTLYLTGFDDTPKLTVTLPGATSYTNSGVTYPTNARTLEAIYTIDFTPGATGAPLTISYATTYNSTDVNANADLQAVAISGGIASPVPEPASLSLLAVGAIGLLTRRRRRSA